MLLELYWGEEEEGTLLLSPLPISKEPTTQIPTPSTEALALLIKGRLGLQLGHTWRHIPGNMPLPKIANQPDHFSPS